MEFPIWQLTTLGGGFWIAVIAVFHVFVAHFAVGGGLFLILTERMARKTGSNEILAYVRGHSKFFLLLTMVAGGVTGVGIWVIIALLCSEGTQTLIHTFVFGWATEWVCFLGEIVALLIYFYGWDRLKAREHMIMGWLYFIFAWLSLFLINGIIGFMLTPGAWLETHNFWDGFFNPSFWPSLIFRTALALMIAGLFGFVTATRVKDEKARNLLVRNCALWAAIPLVVAVASGYLYLYTLPADQLTMITERSARAGRFIGMFVTWAPVLGLGILLMAVRMPQKIKTPLAFLVLVIGFGFFGSFEFIRETGRKPFVIWNHTYSNAIRLDMADKVREEGLLKTAKWVSPENREITKDNAMAVGRELFMLQCSSCHSIGGPMNDILARTAKFPPQGMDSFLSGMGLVNTYMPPFLGTIQERKVLADYLSMELNGHKDSGNAVFEPVDQPVNIPEFTPAEQGGDYVLLTWNNLGMHCISDADPYFVLLPPANDLYAQLVMRGDPPQLVSEGVEIAYKVEPGFENPMAESRFWEFAPKNFGAELEDNVGLSGNGVNGKMHYKEEGWFEAGLIPVVPYPQGQGYNPFPRFIIEAKDKESGKVLATTEVVAPTATEMGCRNCHGGPWKIPGLAGIADETGSDILAVHDRMSKTNLKAEADKGNPKLCQSCHPDPVLNAKGNPELLNLPAALHGLHANYLKDRGADACYNCHPNRPDGPTGCLRGRHAEFSDCTDCHGYLEDHALSLLKKEKEAGKMGADRLMANIKPRTVTTLDEINGRTPWLQEPDCLSCHVNFKAPETNAFNKWTEDGPGLYRMRKDDLDAVMCAACHSSPHATYPANNRYGENRDNVQPLQYQNDPGTLGGKGNCGVCHTNEVDVSAHHENMIR